MRSVNVRGSTTELRPSKLRFLTRLYVYKGKEERGRKEGRKEGRKGEEKRNKGRKEGGNINNSSTIYGPRQVLRLLYDFHSTGPRTGTPEVRL